MFELKNYMEIVVYKSLQEYLRVEKLHCACDRCQADIMALVLNHLPARYFVTQRGEILTTCESNALPNQTKILAEIVMASQQIEASPSHSIDGGSEKIYGQNSR